MKSSKSGTICRIGALIIWVVIIIFRIKGNPVAASWYLYGWLAFIYGDIEDLKEEIKNLRNTNYYWQSTGSRSG